MNQVILSGNLCRDVELKQLSNSENKVVTNCVAVSRDRKEADGTYASDFVNIVVWNKQAEYLAAHGSKGDRVEVSGHLQVRTYQDKNGSTNTITEVVVEKINVFPRNSSDDTKKEDVTVDDIVDDIPF